MTPLECLAVLATGLFTGAAVYVSFVEHPARMACATEIALAEWRPSYRRATLMQAPLAILGFLFSGAASLAGSGLLWLVAGVALLAVVPFTLLVMWPTNRRLENASLEPSSAEARELLSRWARLHAVRAALGLAALMLMLFAA